MRSAGSERRRARERRAAAAARAEGERAARTRRLHAQIDKIEQQRQAREELSSYQPWGRPGGGAPCPAALRIKNVRLYELYPEDELKGASCEAPLQAYRRAGHARPLREDVQLRYQFAEDMRRAVDNDIRYRRTRDQQQDYKQLLDELVSTKKQAANEEVEKNLAFEKKMHKMKGPWGRPGPGGTVWRNPRDIGSNFLQSMGWTDESALSKLQKDHRRRKHNVVLPSIGHSKKSNQKSKTQFMGSPTKLPPVNVGERQIKSDSEEKNGAREDEIKKPDGEKENADPSAKRESAEKTMKVKNGKKVKIVSKGAGSDSGDSSQPKTPNSQILSLTGGVELVPLLARRRRGGARTLHSSDVTRMKEDDCAWRDVSVEYLHDLTSQMRIKFNQKEERKKNSAERCRRHHETWASLWGRPGHGAPLPGRNYRNNLSLLLYRTPVH